MSARGYTLIEVLVVVLIIGIVIGMVGLQVSGSEQRAVRDESERLALLMQHAQEEAILRARPIVFESSAEGYRFLLPAANGKLSVLENDAVLHPRLLPAALQITRVEIDGARAGESARILISPTGEVVPFTIVLEQGAARWQVLGTADGRIRPQGFDA
ncbi:MAG: GspH/FimT family pseudopilin [Gammaproteobacteria bacterium]|nr:GspH/FimT family pseudopilin [Gammaproteobacteria bacterium]